MDTKRFIAGLRRIEGVEIAEAVAAELEANDGLDPIGVLYAIRAERSRHYRQHSATPENLKRISGLESAEVTELGKRWTSGNGRGETIRVNLLVLSR